MAVLLCAAVPAGAEEITLRDGGSVVAEGELLGYDGRYYRLLGDHGEVTLDGSGLGCDGRACPRADWAETFRISGDASSLKTVLPPLLRAHARREGLRLRRTESGGRTTFDFRRDGRIAGRVVLHATSSAEGLADIVADAADLAVSVRPLTPQEAELARQAGRGDLTGPGRSAILALDAIVPLVAGANPLETIDDDALARILAGRLDDWSALGEEPGPIRLHLPAARTGFGEAVAWRLATGGAEATRHADPAALADAVAADTGALGIGLLSSVSGARPLRLAGPCGAEAEATSFAVKAADYPLVLPLFLYAPARRLGAFARDLVDYITSPAAQPLIRRAGLVDQFPEERPFAAGFDRLVRGILSAEGAVDHAMLRRMVTDLKDGARLSVSFRFEEGEAELGAQSAANVALLAEAIADGLLADRDLIFAGFSDGSGGSTTNRALSRSRARAVRDELAARVGVDGFGSTVGAYGEAQPIACDETGWGREVNRRVEVWVR